MPLFNSQNQNVRGIRWRGIVATVMVEVLVLLGLAFAVVRYVEWSSDAAVAEFMSATKSSDPNHSSEFSTPDSVPQGANRSEGSKNCRTAKDRGLTVENGRGRRLFSGDP
jgi:hypothetical protein